MVIYGATPASDPLAPPHAHRAPGRLTPGAQGRGRAAEVARLDAEKLRTYGCTHAEEGIPMGTTGTPPEHPSAARACSRRPGGRGVRGRPGVYGLVALLLVPAVLRAQAMRWPDAIAALAAERTRAETYVRLLKRLRAAIRPPSAAASWPMPRPRRR